MRKVLIPTDFSENAFNALKYACQIFKYEKSEIFILHAYADEVYKQQPILQRDQLNELKEATQFKAETQLQDLLKSIRNYSPNPRHSFKTIAAFGSLIDEANDMVNSENMDIVVMGTKGQTNDKSITFGSNTLQLLRYVHCPVLGIPENYSFQVPKKILFPTNYVLPYNKRELKLLCELSGSFRSTIYLLYIDPLKTLSLRQEDHQVILKACLSKPKLVFETAEEKDKMIAITRYILHEHIDMLVMVNSRHSFLEDLLNDSPINKVGLHIKIPFLILQNIPR